MKRLKVKDIREEFAQKLIDEDFVVDKSGGRVIEIIGATFKANKDLIFGAVNEDYVKRELEWYESQSLYVKDIPGDTPKIWEAVANKNGEINSNYGWCIFSNDNYNQYEKVLDKLLKNPLDRQAVMIYTRPTMHEDSKYLGMSDFMCTNTVQYVIRNNKLSCVVQMRSNDAWAGYRNDVAWQKYVLENLYKDLIRDYPKLKIGDIYWNVGSLHVYDRQFYLVDYYAKTGETSITKEKYKELYPNSRYI